MKTFLLIDFGASRVKSAVCCEGEILDVKDSAPVKPCVFDGVRYEIALEELKIQFLAIVNDYSKKYELQSIFICSEMHGFALLDKTNNPVSNYISWKDERCNEKIDGISSLELLKNRLKGRFFEITGMRERACYPVFNLFHMIRKGEVKSDLECELKVVSLPEWLACVNGKSKNNAHCTMSAGLGFYNLRRKAFDDEIVSAVIEDSKVSLVFNKPVENVEISGYIEIKGRDIPVYTGVGDHQCALYGAGIDEDNISLNLGTGSQAAMISTIESKNEKRPYFDSKILSVITHIPSGRAFNFYKEALHKINSNIDFWKELSKVSIEDIENSSLSINLAVFQSAWTQGSEGEILVFDPSKYSKKNYFASLLKCYLNQYIKAVSLLSSDKDRVSVIMSGGIPKKLPVIKEYLEKYTNLKVFVTNSEYDETLEGLKKLSACII